MYNRHAFFKVKCKKGDHSKVMKIDRPLVKDLHNGAIVFGFLSSLPLLYPPPPPSYPGGVWLAPINTCHLTLYRSVGLLVFNHL
jgi:hypothetical protein